MHSPVIGDITREQGTDEQRLAGRYSGIKKAQEQGDEQTGFIIENIPERLH